MIKVYFAINESGVNFWRGKIPAWKMRELGLADIRTFNIYDYSMEQVEREVLESDVIYMPCATGMEALVEITNHIRRGKAVVVDYDDNLFDCHPFNPAYANLGLYPVTINNTDGTVVELWKDQRHGFSLPDNRKRYFAHIDILNTANLITTTTKSLQGNLLEYVERDPADFPIVPNAINFDIFKPFEKRVRSHKKIRIGWAASDSHIVEARYIVRVFKELFLKRQDFELVILGNMEKFRFMAKDLPIEWHEFTALEVYPMKLASLEFDIGIVPLENHSFNICKSALKWSEYAAMKIPAVVSDLAPYDDVRDGIDGLKAKNEEEFAQKVEALMDDAHLRKTIAQNAYERNREDFNIDKVAFKWLEVFERAHSKPHTVTYKGQPLKPFDEGERILEGAPLNAHRKTHV